jgi:hypothetical protein
MTEVRCGHIASLTGISPSDALFSAPNGPLTPFRWAILPPPNWSYTRVSNVEHRRSKGSFRSEVIEGVL